MSSVSVFANSDTVGKPASILSKFFATRSVTWEVTCSGVNLRDSPSLSGSVICVLSSGTLVNSGRDDYAYDSDGNIWRHVTVTTGTHAGTAGRVSGSCLTEAG